MSKGKDKEKERDKEKKVKPEKAKKEKKQKAKLTENKGISGMGTDYTVYIMSASQKLLAVFAGFAVGFGASYIYFDSTVLGIIIGLITALKAIDIYRKKLLERRSNDLRIQFRDMLESLSNSYTVGMTANKAFHAAYTDMVTEHGVKSYIAKELQLICSMHDNQGVEIKEMVNDFASRSGLDDVMSFAGVFDVSTNLGGDIAKVIRETRDMISDKIEIEMEIQTMVTGQKNQLNILALMPIVMALLTRSFGDGSGGFGVVIVKLIALAMFVFAYWLGSRIVDIKV